MVIRQEQPSDYAEVYKLVQKAFATTSYSDGTEQDYLTAVRDKEAFIPELSLVGVEGNRIVGQIVLYEMEIIGPMQIVKQLVISPLSVLPDYFNQGIGRSLINEGCKRARSLGYKAVFLCGDYSYYSRAGFVPTYQYGIYHINDKEKAAKWCMGKELESLYLNAVSGTVNIE